MTAVGRSWKRWVVGLGVVIAVLVVLWVWVLPRGRQALLVRFLKPAKGFDQYTPPKMPDYAAEEAWAALPTKKSYARLWAKGFEPSKAKQADVFFVHPTTYLSGKGWNAPLEDKEAKRRVDKSVMKYQASAFHGCCRVYAPRYRQATLYFAIARNQDAWKAMDLAFGDVKRAFRHFLKHHNQGRPILLAGHSQGSLHGLRLLEEFPDEGGWRKRLVAAYLVGINIPLDKFKRTIPWLHPCKSPEDTRCVMGWTTLGRQADPQGWANMKLYYPSGYEPSVGKPRLCTNPLTWRSEEKEIAKSRHKGALSYGKGREMRAIRRALIGAGCRDGALWIDTPPPSFQRLMLQPHDYHVYDYNLFYADIWHNAFLRIESYQKKKSAKRVEESKPKGVKGPEATKP